MIRRILLGIALGTTLLGGAFPSPADLKRVQPGVLALMKDEEKALREQRKSRSDVALAAMKFASDVSRSEAERFLLMKGAFALRLRDRAYATACETLDVIWLEVRGFDDVRRELLVDAELRRLPQDIAQAFRAEQVNWLSPGDRILRSGALRGVRKVAATATTPETWYVGSCKVSEEWLKRVVDDVTRFGVSEVKESQKCYNAYVKDRSLANLEVFMSRFPGMNCTAIFMASFAKQEEVRGNLETSERLRLQLLENYRDSRFSHGALIAPLVFSSLKDLYHKLGRDADAEALERKYGGKLGAISTRTTQ